MLKRRLLHIFRNTPFGRDTLMQSVYFCKTLKLLLKVYIPRQRQFLMYFQNSIVTVDLDSSFLRDPEHAVEHAESIIRKGGLTPDFIQPNKLAASTIPALPVNFGYMCCPRSISDLSTKIGLGYIGPKVRSIVRNAGFLVLIPTPVYKEWKGITVFFGGSRNALNALSVGMRIAEASGYPLQIFTQGEKNSKDSYQEILRQHDLLKEIEAGKIEQLFFENGDLRNNLYAVPHDHLVIIGAYGHGLIKDLIFGSMMEKVQSVLPNNMLIVGPNYLDN